MGKLGYGLIATALLTLASASRASADTWLLPQTSSYLSADHQTRLTITPRDIESQLAYFQDKADGRESAGGPAGNAGASAVALLEKRGPDGRWTLLWRQRLLNEVAPVEALVANDGRHVVTFDNWHSTGYADNVIVIYDSRGEVIRSLGLDDFLAKSRIEKLPRSVSSINWGGRHQISGDGSRLNLKVLAPGQDPYAENARYETLQIDLATGQPVHSSMLVPAAGVAAGLMLLAGAILTGQRLRRGARAGPT